MKSDFWERFEALREKVISEGYKSLTPEEEQWYTYAEDRVNDWSSDIDYDCN